MTMTAAAPKRQSSAAAQLRALVAAATEDRDTLLGELRARALAGSELDRLRETVRERERAFQLDLPYDSPLPGDGPFDQPKRVQQRRQARDPEAAAAGVSFEPGQLVDVFKLTDGREMVCSRGVCEFV